MASLHRRNPSINSSSRWSPSIRTTNVWNPSINSHRVPRPKYGPFSCHADQSAGLPVSRATHDQSTPTPHRSVTQEHHPRTVHSPASSVISVDSIKYPPSSNASSLSHFSHHDAYHPRGPPAIAFQDQMLQVMQDNRKYEKQLQDVIQQMLDLQMENREYMKRTESKISTLMHQLHEERMQNQNFFQQVMYPRTTNESSQIKDLLDMESESTSTPSNTTPSTYLSMTTVLPTTDLQSHPATNTTQLLDVPIDTSQNLGPALPPEKSTHDILL